MAKIKVKNPIVEMNGDEMTRIIWDLIRQKIVLANLDIQLKEYDLGLKKRDDSDDRITIEAANAIAEHKVGVKCATITPDADRVTEYGLKKQWKSPNGTIRNILNGTIFRKPITTRNIKPWVRAWEKPIVVGRHAYGDLYRSEEFRIPEAGTTKFSFTPNSDPGKTETRDAFEFKGPGIIMIMHNTDESIRAFANNCITYAVSEKLELWHSVKDTISKTYHARFKTIFAEEAAKRKAEMDAAGIAYRYLLIDDAVAQSVKHKGGFVWALRNYDGDVLSDFVAAGFGSLGMMTSVLVSPNGAFEFEAAHGTVKRHFYEHKKGNPTSTNSVASMFAWTGALRKRGELDGTPEVCQFADAWERSIIELIESGVMTKDLCALVDPPTGEYETTEGFIDKVARKITEKLSR